MSTNGIKASFPPGIFFFLASCISLVILAGRVDAGAKSPLRGDGVRACKHMSTWKELRDRDVVKQKYDYSCGSGALATLMGIGFGDKVSEAEVIRLILQGKSGAEIKDIEKNGYSLLDLKQAAEKMGYITAMYKLQLAHLRQLKGPVLIYIVHHELKHFAVFKRIRGDRVYLADPARGNVRMSIYRFEREWPGYILAIGKQSGFRAEGAVLQGGAYPPRDSEQEVAFPTGYPWPGRIPCLKYVVGRICAAATHLTVFPNPSLSLPIISQPHPRSADGIAASDGQELQGRPMFCPKSRGRQTPYFVVRLAYPGERKFSILLLT